MISEDGRVAGLFVYVQLDGKPVVAGRFLHQDNVGIFYYGNSYIQREDAFALDPINLPLVPEREFSTRANRGYFGVLLDAGPDSWGKRVLSEIAKSRPRNDMEYLLAGNGQGIGQRALAAADRARTGIQS
jgi:serine/threonine-protein kinase HipA